MKKIFLSISVLLLSITYSSAKIQTIAKQAYIYDVTSKTVMLNKGGNVRMFPASMTKLMTIYLVFERLQEGSLSLKDKFYVSRKAYKKGGSKTFLKLHTNVTVIDLLRGVIVQSGNDSAIALAEGIGGTEENFAILMNEKAMELGMQKTNFRNSTGWPDKQHYTTAKDLAILAQAMIKNFPEYYPMWAEKSFTFNGIKQYNRNPLLYKKLGADGLKTGHTSVSGYGLVGTLKYNGRRVIMILNGMNNKKERRNESIRLATKVLFNYKTATLFKAGEIIDNISVVRGAYKSVPAIINQDIVKTLLRHKLKNITVKVQYTTPIQAPVKKGSIIGKLIISVPGEIDSEEPILAGKAIKKAGFIKRIENRIRYFLTGEI